MAQRRDRSPPTSVAGSIPERAARSFFEGPETFSDPGPISRKLRKLSGPGKPFLIVCILKTKKYIGMKLCMKGNFVRIKNMSKEQLCKLKV